MLVLALCLVQNGGRPPSWISCVHIWNTHNEYVVLFINSQNLLEIDQVV